MKVGFGELWEVLRNLNWIVTSNDSVLTFWNECEDEVIDGRSLEARIMEARVLFFYYTTLGSFYDSARDWAETQKGKVVEAIKW